MGLDFLQNLKSARVNHIDFAGGTLGNVEFTIMNSGIHADVAFTFFISTHFDLLDLTGLQINGRHKETARYECFAGGSIHLHLTRMLDPIFISLLSAVVGPQEIEIILVVHRHSVITSIRNPNGAILIIHVNTKSTQILIPSVVSGTGSGDRQGSYSFYLESLLIQTRNSRYGHITVRASNEDLAVL